jgi:hypothetical protein
MPDQRTVQPHRSPAAGLEAALTLAVVAGAFWLYAAGAAPGLTWAHQGADGGELVTAAVVNGVPHPPGYPLYIMLLQAWLWLAQSAGLRGDLNWQAALFSALCAALSAGVTLHTAHRLLLQSSTPAKEKAALPGSAALLWATLAAIAWAISPLLWTQAVIAEVYALHALLLALLGAAVLVYPGRLWYIALLVALGVANHLTTLLLLPAAAYSVWVAQQRATPGRSQASLLRVAAVFGAGLLMGALFYGRIPLAARGAPPVNWGYADNWAGFWWLVSGAAYRGYLFDGLPAALLPRLASWAYSITAQYTPIGLALALVGLAHWDRTAAHLRNFSLLWLLPVSAYAVVYYTRDSDIYLLPVGWLLALWLAVGLAQMGEWAWHHWPGDRLLRRAGGVVLLGALVGAGLVGLTAWRWPGASLAADQGARDYLVQAAAVLEPGSIVVTLDDRETFAFWYGVWGSQELGAHGPGVVPVNDSLYQFAWYRRLQGELYPDIIGIDESVDALIAANRGVRPIYFAQLPVQLAESELLPAGPLWKLKE